MIQQHFDSLNEGIRTGDFASMCTRLSDSALMEFHGIPVGPFQGRSAILAAYESNPPDEAMIILRSVAEGDSERAQYAWSSSPDVVAGEVELHLREGLIDRISIWYGCASGYDFGSNVSRDVDCH